MSSFYACVPNIMITLCTIPEIRHATDEQINKQTDGKSEKGGAPPKK